MFPFLRGPGEGAVVSCEEAVNMGDGGDVPRVTGQGTSDEGVGVTN